MCWYGQTIQLWWCTSTGRVDCVPLSCTRWLTNFVEQCASPVTESHSCPRSEELWSRPTLQEQSSLWRMETPSRGGQSHLGALRLPQCGSAYFRGKHTVPHVLLPEGSGCSTGDRCSSTRVASQAALCISPSRPDTAHAGQSEGEGLIAHHDSPSLAR